MVTHDLTRPYDRATEYLRRRGGVSGRKLGLVELLAFAIEAIAAVNAECGDGRGASDLSPKRIALEWLFVSGRWLADCRAKLSATDEDLFAELDRFRARLKAAGGGDASRDQAMVRLACFALSHENIVEELLKAEEG